MQPLQFVFNRQLQRGFILCCGKVHTSLAQLLHLNGEKVTFETQQVFSISRNVFFVKFKSQTQLSNTQEPKRCTNKRESLSMQEKTNIAQIESHSHKNIPKSGKLIVIYPRTFFQRRKQSGWRSRQHSVGLIKFNYSLRVQQLPRNNSAGADEDGR